MLSVLVGQGKMDTQKDAGHLHTEERTCENEGRRQHLQARKKTAQEASPAHTLVFNLQSPELWESNCGLNDGACGVLSWQP